MNERIRDHWDGDSASYNKFVRKGFSVMRERRAWQGLFTKVIGTRSLNVLDVGCGPGIVSMQLSDMGHHVTSLDFSLKMLEAAEKNAAYNGLSIDFHLGDAENLPFQDDTFDALVSDYVLWTLPHPEKALSEWYRVVKPGSKVVYVDGDWWSDPRSTWINTRLSNLGVFLDSPSKYLRSKRKGEGPNEDLRGLWSANASRPAADVEMMRKAGFGNVQVIHDIQERVLHGVRYLAYGSTNDHFMVTGVKPHRDGAASS